MEVRLTKPQQRELERIANEPQPTYGSSRTRIQNTLVRMGFARYSSGGDRCVIAPDGARLLFPGGGSEGVAGGNVGGDVSEREDVPTGSGRRYYIQDSRSYWGDALVWWRPEGKGYTVDVDQAGIFEEGFLKGLRKTDVPWLEEVVKAARKTRVVVAGSLRIAASRQGGGE